MQKHKIPTIDAVIVNFYDLEKKIAEHGSFENLRQAIDIGGPTLCHSSRKSFISTVVVASVESYPFFLKCLEKYGGCINFECRFELARQASKYLTKVMLSIDNVFQNAKYEDIKKCYLISN